MKTLCADASVDFVDVKVGHCQALNLMPFINEKREPSPTQVGGGFFVSAPKMPFSGNRYPVNTKRERAALLSAIDRVLKLLSG